MAFLNQAMLSYARRTFVQGELQPTRSTTYLNVIDSSKNTNCGQCFGAMSGHTLTHSFTHLIGIDAIVDGPGGLKVLQHPLLQLLRQPMDTDEVFQVLHSGVVERASRVHALDDGRHVAKHHGVHQS